MVAVPLEAQTMTLKWKKVPWESLLRKRKAEHRLNLLVNTGWVMAQEARAPAGSLRMASQRFRGLTDYKISKSISWRKKTCFLIFMNLLCFHLGVNVPICFPALTLTRGLIKSQIHHAHERTSPHNLTLTSKLNYILGSSLCLQGLQVFCMRFCAAQEPKAIFYEDTTIVAIDFIMLIFFLMRWDNSIIYVDQFIANIKKLKNGPWVAFDVCKTGQNVTIYSDPIFSWYPKDKIIIIIIIIIFL